MQRVRDQYLGHHLPQADDHHVQQAQLLDHLERETLVREQLDAHVHDPVAQRVRIVGHLEHARYPAVVHDEGAREMFLKREKL